MDKKYKKLAKNTLWISFGTFGSRTISFFLLPIFTRVLSKESYGKIDIFSTTVSLLTILLSLEIAAAVFRFSAGSESSNDRKILSSSYVVILLSLISFFFIFPLFTKVNNFFVQMKCYLLLSLIFSILNSINKNYIRAKEKMLIYATSDILNTFSFATLGIVFVAILKKGVLGYFQAYLFSQAITAAYVFISGKIYKKISYKYVSKETLKEMVKYSLPFIPNDLSWWIMNISDRYLIVYFLGFAAAGIYGVSYKFMGIVSILNAIFYQAWQVSAIEQYDKSGRDQFYSSVFKYLSTSLIGILLLFSIVMKPFVKIMVGNEFEMAWKFLPFLMLGALFSAFSSFYGVGYITSKESKGAFSTSLFGALANFVINIFFIPLIGIQAAAMSTMIAFLLMWILRLKHTKRYFIINVDWKVFGINLILVSASLFLSFLKNYGIYFQIVIFIIFIIVNYKFLAYIYKLTLLKIKSKISS
jgi:O-antigen/teichoic acid export membrane protein